MCCGRDVLTGAVLSLITEEDEEDEEEGLPPCMVIALLLSSATLISCDASLAEATTAAAAVGAEIRAFARVSSNCALRWDRNSARFWLM